MLTNLIYLLILIVGFPAGIILSNLCKDEIKAWRFRLFSLSVISFIILIVLLFMNINYKIPIIVTLFFIIITCLTIIWRTHQKPIPKKKGKTGKKSGVKKKIKKKKKVGRREK